MSFIDKIEKLQKKPESYRKKLLAISVTLIMILIIIFWASFLDFSLDKKQLTEEKISPPFDVIKNDFTALKKSLNSSWSGVKNLFMELNKFYGKE